MRSCLSMSAISVSDQAAFDRAVSALVEFRKVSGLLAPNFAVAMAVLLHRGTPSGTGGGGAVIGTPGGSPLTTHDLQALVCDPTWEKSSAFVPSGSSGPIYKPFTVSFKPNSPATNNWRNSFDPQSGLGCDAPYGSTHLLSSAFLAERRTACEFRDSSTGACGSPAGLQGSPPTCFNPNKRSTPPGPESAAAHRPKLLARGTDSGGNAGYWVVEPTADVLADLLGNKGMRVPAAAFASALYCGSAYWQALGNDATVDRLEADLALPVALRQGSG